MTPLHDLLAAAAHLVAADHAARDCPKLRGRIRAAIMPLLADLLADAACAAQASVHTTANPNARPTKPRSARRAPP